MGQLRHLDNLDDRVEDVLEKIGLLDRSESLIKNISKGMRQRVGLGQALIHEPEVLILDEPTIGLDPKQIREVRNLIQEIGKERTVLLSTHILSEAQQICDRVIIINKGHIVAEDAPENLQNRLSSSRKVSVRVGADSEKAVELIKKVKGVVSARLGPNGVIEFENPSSQDSRAEVAKLLVNQGFDLLELTPEIVNLEDIFLKLTRDETSPAEVSKKPAAKESEA
jgi:ABC-2 type transport system ATP-binding protein